MGRLLNRLQAGSDSYDLEETGYGFVLIRRVDCDDAFGNLVRHLVDWGGDEFVVLPVTDGGRSYERVILLPY